MLHVIWHDVNAFLRSHKQAQLPTKLSEKPAPSQMLLPSLVMGTIPKYTVSQFANTPCDAENDVKSRKIT